MRRLEAVQPRPNVSTAKPYQRLKKNKHGVMLNLSTSPVIGRFAPSPTGALHLVTGDCGACQLLYRQTSKGKWLVRIEDTDTERCHPKFSDLILADLERLGLHWDGNVRYQSRHLDTYHALLDEQLKSSKLWV